MSTLISVYFKHDKRSPGNVLHAWHQSPAVPRVGDLVLTTWRETWRVLEVTWLDGVQGRSAELLVTTVESATPVRSEAKPEMADVD